MPLKSKSKGFETIWWTLIIFVLVIVIFLLFFFFFRSGFIHIETSTFNIFKAVP